MIRIDHRSFSRCRAMKVEWGDAEIQVVTAAAKIPGSSLQGRVGISRTPYRNRFTMSCNRRRRLTGGGTSQAAIFGRHHSHLSSGGRIAHRSSPLPVTASTGCCMSGRHPLYSGPAHGPEIAARRPPAAAQPRCSASCRITAFEWRRSDVARFLIAPGSAHLPRTVPAGWTASSAAFPP